MSYTLNWTNPALPGKGPINVPVASAVSTAAPLVFTGKGAANYGALQQQNLMGLLENWANSVAPSNPTIGQLWYNSTTGVLSVCTGIAPDIWETLSGIQVSNTPPLNPSLGDMWFDQTGGYTGVFYVYTGTGRHPLSVWDPVVSAAFSEPSPNADPFAGIKINYQDFTTPNYGEGFIHGFTPSTNIPADVNGGIDLAGQPALTLPKGAVSTELPGKGFIVYDSTATLLLGGVVSSARYFAVREVGLDSWEYDNNTTWVPFTPIAGMYTIGTIEVAEPDDNTPPGIITATIWQAARPLVAFRAAAFDGTVGPGGWNQIWPSIDYFGTRFEFDAMLERVLALIGSPFTFGGNDAIRGLPVSDLQTLDAAMYAYHESTPQGNRDPNFAPLSGGVDSIKMETTSRDWDLLLAAARWAVSRLDLPVGMYQDISQVPFTQDGHVIPAELEALPDADPRHPPEARRTQRRWGAITGTRLYTETMNVLGAALAARYTIAGMLGTNSTVLAFGPAVSTSTHCSHDALYLGGANTTLFLTFNFETDEERAQFANGGSCLETVVTFAPASVTPNNTAFTSFLSSFATFRVVADNVYVLSSGGAIASAPLGVGLNGAPVLPAYSTVTVTQAGHTMTMGVAKRALGPLAPDSYTLRLTINAPAGLTGTTTVEHRIIRDTSTFGSPTPQPFFPPPRAFVPTADDSGDGVGTTTPHWIGGVVVPAPTASFTMTPNPATGNPSNITLQDTSTGAPTSIDWDFTNNGSVDLTTAPGASTIQSYPAGVYAVRMVATNAGGSDIVTQTLTVNSPVAAPTITLFPSITLAAHAAQTNPPVVIGSYTGTITTVTVNSGPGLFIHYVFSGGLITYQGPVFLSNAGPISLTVSNIGGTATGTSNLTVTPIGFALVATTPSTIQVNSFISMTPRRTILQSSTPGNAISNGSVASGALPPGINLQFNQGGNGDVIFGGTATTPGTYSFTLQVFDANCSLASPATSGSIAIIVEAFSSTGTIFINRSSNVGVNWVGGTNLNDAAATTVVINYFGSVATPTAPTLLLGVTGGLLPPGLSIAQTGPGGAGEWSYVGTPTLAGVYTFQLTASGIGNYNDPFSSTATVTFTVNP